MGKQSRRRRKEPASGTASNSDDHKPSDSAIAAEVKEVTICSGASCWICLDEGPDDSGQPLIRDCSCRGDSGYYHLSCIIKYAEKKSEEWDGLESKGMRYEIGDYSKPWRQCPNCNQSYQNTLLLDLADGLISFTKKLYPCHPAIRRFGFPCDPVMFLEALDTKTDAYRHMIQKSDNGPDEVHYREESKRVASEIISLVEQIKTHIYGVGSPVPFRVSSQEAGAYSTIGICLVEEAQLISGSNKFKESSTFKSGMKHLEKSRDLARLIGDTIFANDVENRIAQAKQFSGDGDNMIKHTIKYLREEYNKDPSSGNDLLMALQSKLCIIECERLLEEMIPWSRRVNGPNHDEAKMLENLLDNTKSRKGTMLAPFIAPGNEGIYNILRYIENGDKCVLKGPWAKLNCPQEEARNINAEEIKTIVVESDTVLLSPGTPVICQGLKNASHLNGKIGDVRGYGKGKMGDVRREFGNGGAFRYSVHFEDESLKPCLVKPENVRVLFDLPAKV